MVYVFDTSSFMVIGHYYPQQFPSFWNKFDQAVEIGNIISVTEVFRELDQDASALICQIGQNIIKAFS